ncbi:FUSC family protein [Plesiomonas shigelloides]|uniref:FUSC family protein n=1 Tax=Plesiomonas shigelloides TaxID=703 RepID=UPI002118834D|nr:FUSC family protein [Plesiomonas shigelloides]MCQ8858696.1 FUSC family protein [Plesiomonas shigelloides]
MNFISFREEFAVIRRELLISCEKIKALDFSYSNVLSAVLSVGLAILICHLLRMEYSTWAAFSAYVIMRPVFKQTWHRGLLRIAGTLLGALCAIGFLLLCRTELSLALLCAAILLVNTATAYYTNVASDEYNYAILFFGLTFTLIVSYAYVYPDTDIFHIGMMRTGDVMIGSLSTIAVGMLIQRIWPDPAPTATNTKPHAESTTSAPKNTAVITSVSAPTKAVSWPFCHLHFLFALLAGVTITLMPLSTLVHHNSLFIQAAVSILAVSNQPRSVQADDLPISTARKLIYRATGCFLGGVAGIICNLISVVADSYVLLVFLTLLGTAFGRIIQDSSKTASYVGTQFTVGLLMVCVHDTTQLVNDSYGVYRFAGVFMGFLIFVPALFILASLFYRYGSKPQPPTEA